MLLILVLLASLYGAAAHPTTKVCPILGPSFPKPTDLSSSQVFQDAVDMLDSQLNIGLLNGSSPFGHGAFNRTTWSLGMFSANTDGLLYQRHHTSYSVATGPGAHNVDADSCYRIGSISKLMTVLTLLAVDGDESFIRPVTDYIPELASQPAPSFSQNGVLPQWDQITVGDLATHLGGIVSDYGADDLETFYSRNPGLPKLPKSRLPVCGYQIGVDWITCSKQKDIKGIASIPAIFSGGATPSYSNMGFDLVGAVIEKITGVSQETSFNASLVNALGLTRAFFGTPSDPSYGAIPSDAARAGWYQDLGLSNADGGNTFSTNDLAAVGKAIMNSTLLPLSLTRRWLKPRTFTADVYSSVGAPWEIFRWPTSNRLYDLYTKDGGEGAYASMFILVPDLGFGYTVLTTGAAYRPPMQIKLASMMTTAVLASVEETARQQAQKNFGGVYRHRLSNSTLVITTDEQPGLRVTEWYSEGKNVLEIDVDQTDQFDYLDFRLWPNELYNGTKVGFTAAWEILPRRMSSEHLWGGSGTCNSWSNTGFTQYGNVALGSFVFSIDTTSGEAVNVELEALAVSLERET